MHQSITVKRGFALLTTVISLLVFSTFLTLALTQFSLGMNATAQTVSKGAQALVFADSCIESALASLRGNPDLSDMHLTLPTGDGCEIEVQREDIHYTIESHATVDVVTRSVIVEATRESNFVTVSSWLEQ